MRVKASNSKAKPAPAVETSESINSQIAAFLKQGGEIQQIAKGVSGQTFGPSKQITLGKNPHYPLIHPFITPIDERASSANHRRYACTRLDRAFA
eukprot:gene8302-9751_t